MRQAIVVVVALLVLVGLAGCAQGNSPTDSSSDAPGVEVKSTATTGIIKGVVVDSGIRPLVKAVVTIKAGGKILTNMTNNSGGFGFANLDPGTYFVSASKAGFLTGQTSAEVKANDDSPPSVRLVLEPDRAYSKPYYSVQKQAGYIECTTSVIATCGAPNVVSNVLLCPAFNICLGNITDDRFGIDFYYEPNASMIQSEMFWDTSQALSPELTLSMENISECVAPGDSYNEGVTGTSPIFNIADAKEIAAGTIGGRCSIFHSVFSGGVGGTPAGVTAQQKFEIISHSFYGYNAPEGWRFSKDGNPPTPA